MVTRVTRGGVVESLRWYGLETAEPPEGYWEEFWDRWSPDVAGTRHTGGVTVSRPGGRQAVNTYPLQRRVLRQGSSQG